MFLFYKNSLVLQAHLIFWNYFKMFVSGMPICEAFAQIEQQPNIYDVVHVKYYDEVWIIVPSYISLFRV